MCFPICEGFCYSRVCNDTERRASNTARLVVKLETTESRKTLFFFSKIGQNEDISAVTSLRNQ